MSTRTLAFCAALAAALLTGCGSAAAPSIPVSGRLESTRDILRGRSC